MSTPSRSLSPTQLAVLQSIRRHGLMTSSQIERSHYSGTKGGRRVRRQRHLARLAKLGLLKHSWTIYPDDAPAQGLYEPADLKPYDKRNLQHSLDITELWVQLVECGAEVLTFEREPWCHIHVGHVVLKPDAYVRVRARRTARYFIEVDRGNEYERVIKHKLRAYVSALNSGHWPEDEPFPIVLWTVPDAETAARLLRYIKPLKDRDLFKVVQFSYAIDVLTH